MVEHIDLERDVEYYLKKRVNAVGGYIRKFKFIGVTGGPDRLVIIRNDLTFLELKKPSKKPIKPSARQLEEHHLLKTNGQIVKVIASRADVDEFIRSALGLE